MGARRETIAIGVTHGSTKNAATQEGVAKPDAMYSWGEYAPFLAVWKAFLTPNTMGAAV